MKSESSLIYFLSETHYFERDYSVLGVTLVGPLATRNQVSFEECSDQILKSMSKCVIINFRDVPGQIDENIISLLDHLLKSLREKPVHIRLSGVHPDLRRLFQEKQMVQSEEIVNNLADALSSLPLAQRKTS